MVLLVDDEKQPRIAEIRDQVRNSGIPCISVSLNDIQRYSDAVMVFAFVPTENYLNIVSLRCKRVPLLAVNESGSRIYNKDVLFFDKEKHSSYLLFILGFIKDKYGIEAGKYHTYDASVIGREVVCGVNKFSLTPAEYRIISLLAVSRSNWICEKVIADVCFDDPSKSCRVSVHICNINNKAKLYIGHPLIRTKRGKGYMLEE